MTDDRDLIRRRKSRLFGKTIELRGTKRAALEYLPVNLARCAELLAGADDVIVAVSSSGAWIIAPSWLATRLPV